MKDYLIQIISSYYRIIFVILAAIIYMIAWINRIVYIRKIYKLDIVKLEQKKKSEIAGIRTKMTREGTMRYASQIAKGIIGAVEKVADEEILRRKLKYKHDMINSFITAITQFFKR